MPATAITADDIAVAANSPASASVDGRTAAAVPIPDQIKAFQFAAEAEAAEGTNSNGGPKSAWRGTRMARAIPPGAV